MMQIGFSYVCGPSNSLIFVCVYLPILLIVFTFDHFVVGLFSIVYLHSSFIFFFTFNPLSKLPVSIRHQTPLPHVRFIGLHAQVGEKKNKEIISSVYT